MMFRSGRKLEYTIPLPAKLVSFLKNKPARTVLELGCGYGRVCFFLQANSFEVVGVDVDRAQVRLALQETRLRQIHEGIDFVVNDASNMCFRISSFDAITMLGVLTLVSRAERSKIMKEVGRVLRPSGYLLIEEFGRTWKNPIYRKRYKNDVGVTGELGTVVVKDETEKVLHFGHHFTRRELDELLTAFRVISLEKDTFTSYYHRNWVKGYTILAQKKAG